MSRATFLPLTVAFLVMNLGWAQSPVLTPSDVNSGITSAAMESGGDVKKFEQLLDWEHWLNNSIKSFDSDSMEQAVSQAESCVQRIRSLDIHLPGYANILNDRARGLARGPRQSLAGNLSRLALEADPTKLSNIISARRLAHAGRGYSIGMALQDVFTALDFFGPRLKTASQLIIWASLLAMFWSSLFFLYLSTRHLPHLIHFLSERMPRLLSLRERTIISASLVAGFLIAGAVISLPLVVGLLMMAGLVFCIKKERWLSLASIVLLALAGVGMGLGYRMVAVQEEGYLPLLEVANHSPYSHRLEKRLQEEQSARPEDLKPLFALSLLRSRIGDHAAAAAQYRLLLDLRPEHPLTLNNLGNIYFRRGILDSAREMYSQAITHDERLAVAHYNLGQVYFLSLRFPEGRRELEKASSLDAKQIALRSGQASGGLVLDALIPPGVLWANVWNGWSIMEGFDRKDFWTLAGPGFWLPALGSIVLVTLFLVVFILVYNKKAGRCCQTCGRPVCLKCNQNATEEFCPRCAEKIYAAQSPELQEKVMRSLKPLRHKRTMISAIIANAVLPGSVWAILGKPSIAWLWAMMWASILATWRTWGLDFYPARALKLLGLGSWLLMLMAILLYLLSWLGLMVSQKQE